MKDILRIEKDEIEFAKSNQLYKCERDRLKSRFFIYHPNLNVASSLNEINSLIKSDMIARSQRLLGKNVLFPLIYNDFNYQLITNSARLGIPLINYVLDTKVKSKELIDRLEISYNPEKCFDFSLKDYHHYIQTIFKELYRKEYIYQKVDYLVTDDKKVYQKHEYNFLEGKCYNENNELLSCIKKNVFVLNVSKLKEEVSFELQAMKDDVLKGLGYQTGLEITFNLTNEEILTLNILKPETLFGISFIVINPTLMDIEKYINPDEEIVGIFAYSGVDLINHFAGVNIPIFISENYDEAIHIGIPSESERDEMLASNFDLPYYPIYDYIDGKKVLVNSRFLNGYKIKDAREKMIDICIKNHGAKYFETFLNDEIIISSPGTFGIPIPLTNDLKIIDKSLVYDMKYEVRVSDDVIVNNAVRDFLNPLFLEMFSMHAAMLYSEVGYDYLDYFSDQVDVMVLGNDKLKQVGYYLLGEKLLKQIGLANPLSIKKIKIFETVSFNNLSDFLDTNGSSIIRILSLLEKGEKSLEEAENTISLLIEISGYPQDDNGLDSVFLELKENLLEAVRYYNFREYLDLLVSYMKKVRKIKKIPYAQLKSLIIYFSVITPALCEELRRSYLRLQSPLCYYNFFE